MKIGQGASEFSIRSVASQGVCARCARAFTLIEMVVVVVLLAVVAGFLAPRVLSTDDRLAESEARSLQRLLSALAQRDGSSSQALALMYEADRRMISVLSRSMLATETGASSDWMQDRLIPALTFEYSEILDGAADGRRFEGGDWFVEISSSWARPVLSVLVAPRGGERAYAWQIDLLPDASAATLTPVGGRQGRVAPVQSRRVDLDDAGRGRVAW